MSAIEHESWNEEYADDYDAFDVIDEADGEEPLLTAPGQLAGAPARTSADRTPQKSDEERLDELFERMPTRGKVLLGILELCKERKSAGELPALADELQARNKSVFTGATLVGLLEQAGGLRHVNEDGTVYVAPADKPAVDPDARPGEAVDETETPAEDDAFEVEYLEVEEPVATYWLTTEAGLTKLAANDPRARLLKLLEEDAVYRPVYRDILETMADSALTKPQIDAIVKANPLTHEPRRLGGYFVDRLEKADAITWEGAWAITGLGREALELEELYE